MPRSFEEQKELFEKSMKKTLSRFPERKEKFLTGSDKDVERLYTKEDTENISYEESLGFPGIYPYTRGVQPTMYRGRLWTMRQYAGFGNAEESNERYKFLLQKGQTGLSIAFDLPTRGSLGLLYFLKG